MMNRLTFEAVDHHLRDVCDNQNAFGGKLVLLGRDFRQKFPVIAHRSCEFIITARYITQYSGTNVVLCTCV